MRTESEIRDSIAEIIETVFSRFPVPRYMGAFFFRPTETSCYELHIVSGQPFTEADGRVFQDMDGFHFFVPTRVAFRFDFEVK